MMLLYSSCYRYYISLYFIPFCLFLLYPDVMGNYVLKSYDVIKLFMFFGRWSSQKIHSYNVNVTDVVVTGVRCY